MEQIAGTSCNITKSNSIANKNEQPYVTINWNCDIFFRLRPVGSEFLVLFFQNLIKWLCGVLRNCCHNHLLILHMFCVCVLSSLPFYPPASPSSVSSQDLQHPVRWQISRWETCSRCPLIGVCWAVSDVWIYFTLSGQPADEWGVGSKFFNKIFWNKLFCQPEFAS